MIHQPQQHTLLKKPRFGRDAASLWDKPLQDGRPAGLIHEGPMSQDSFLLGTFRFGGPELCHETVRATAKPNDQYMYVEHYLFEAPVFPQWNQPFVNPETGQATLRWQRMDPVEEAGRGFVDQKALLTNCLGQPVGFLRRWYKT